MSNGRSNTVIAITGATGYLGAATMASLVRTPGHGLRVLIHAVRPADATAEFVVGSILDQDACEGLVSGSDVVIHAAGLVRSRDAITLRDVNVKGTARLLRAAERAGVGRFIHVSSTGVYGHPGGVVNETSARRPVSPYERSKAEAEELVLASGLDVVVLQPSNIIGPGHPLRPLRRFLTRISAGRPVVHAGAWTNYVGVDDVAHAIVVAATAADTPRAVIVNAPLPLESLTRLAAEVLGRSPRTITLPKTVGRILRPPLGILARSVPALGRLEALVDGTRFQTAHESWFRGQDLAPDLRATLGEMAREYGLR